MNEKKLVLKETKTKNIIIFVISVISLIIIVFTSLYWNNNKSTIIQNVSISVLAASIYYFFSDFFSRIFVKKKAERISNTFYKSIAFDINTIISEITGEKNWNKYSYKELRDKAYEYKSKWDWYSESRLVVKEIDGINWVVKSKQSILQLVTQDFEEQLSHIENIFEWCDERDFLCLCDFYQTYFFKKLGVLKKLTDEKPKDYEHSFEKCLHEEIFLRLVNNDNEKMIKELGEFVKKYIQ